MEYFVGDNLTVKCREGYKLIGQDVLTCSNTSQWTPQIPHCTRIGEWCTGSVVCYHRYTTPNRDWKRRHVPEISLFRMLRVVSVICIVY